MKSSLTLIFLAVLLLFWPVASMGGHTQGEETNVVVLVCAIDKDPPHRIHVRALSINRTSAHVPTISTKTTCAQALHELMTAGFEIAESDLENGLVFVLTRIDHGKPARRHEH